MVRTQRSFADRAVAEWQKAERGTRGLPAITFKDFKAVSASRRVEALDSVGGVVILTHEGLYESCVIMTMEKYFNLLPVNANPKRVPRRIRHEGIMYREEI